MTARRLLAGGLAAVAALSVSGCADIPTSSAPRVIAQSVPTTAAQTDDDLRYDEIVPRPGELPVDIVSEYLRAGGSATSGHAKARAYLTPDASRSWRDGEGVMIFKGQPYFNPTDTNRDSMSVEMIGIQQIGQLAKDGSYSPGGSEIRYKFRLKRVNGNWRIDNPPNGLLIDAGTFGAAYRRREVYFLNSTRTQVVPDIRWYNTPQTSLPDQLVAALAGGPSKWIQDAVLSDLDGITPETGVVQEPDRVKVYLSGMGDQADTLSAGGFAQLVWTLQQAGVGGVEIYVDGRLLAPQNAPKQTLQMFDDWQRFSPVGTTNLPPGYFIRDGAVRTTKDEPLNGDAGRESFGAVAIAVSGDERVVGVVRQPEGRPQELWVGPPADLRRVLVGASLSRPTWAPGSGEAWTVRNGDEVVMVRPTGGQSRVQVTGLAAGSSITAVRLSADGTRVALVAGPRGQEELMVGIVVRDNGLARIDGLRTLDITDVPVSDVTWADSLSLVALTRAGEPEASLWGVDIDAYSDTDGYSSPRLVPADGLPGPPTAVAAGPNLPLLTVAAGALWSTPSLNQRWVRVQDEGNGDSAPTYPG